MKGISQGTGSGLDKINDANALNFKSSEFISKTNKSLVETVHDYCVKGAKYQALVLTSMYLASLYHEQDLFLSRKIIHWIKPLPYLSHPRLQAVACRLNVYR